jgi:predicted dehydrogenase
MTAQTLLAVGVIGAGRHGAALAEHQAPLADVRIARWAASPGGGDISAVREFAARIDAPFAREWEAVARDPELRAVLVLGEAGSASAAAEAALGAGKAVFCAIPAATRMEDVNRLEGAATGGRAILLAGGTVRLSPAGRAALGLIRDGTLGPLHSVFASLRLPLSGNGDRLSGTQRAVLDDAGWDLLDFIAAAIPAPPSRVNAHVEPLFGAGALDTAVCIIRFEDDVIATLDVARCLPPSLAAPPDGDVEVELIGAREAVRLQPAAGAVRVYAAGPALRPWVDAPVIEMLAELAAAATNGGAASGDGIANVRRAMELMDGIRAASVRARTVPSATR